MKEQEVRPINKKRRVIRRSLISLAVVIPSVSAGGTIYEAQRMTGGSYVSAIPELLNGPSDRGEIVLQEGKKYNFVAIGDSLAAGLGGDKRLVDGKKMPESWVSEIVDSVNKKSPDLASQLHLQSLAVPSSSAEELNARLKTYEKQLVDIPNLVLCMSAEYQAVNRFVADLRENDYSKLEIPGVLENHLDSYSEDLSLIAATLDTIQSEREKKGKGSMGIIALGLPELQSVPRVKELIDKGVIDDWQVKTITNLFNTRLAKAIKDESRKREDISFAFADIADTSIKSKFISKDGLHPNQDGYDAIAHQVAAAIIRVRE